MTLAERLIVSARREGDRAAFLGADPRLFLPDELPLVAAVRAHLSSHGVFPEDVTLEAEGFALSEEDAPEPPAYYVARMRSRAMFNVVREHHPSLLEAMRTKDAQAALDALRAMTSGASNISAVNTTTTLAEEASRVLEDYHAAKDTPGLRGVTLGYPSLDEATMGAQGGDLIVVAGRTGLGKSWVLIEMAYQAWRAGKHVSIVTMEMGTLQVVRRFIGRHTGLNPNFIRGGRLSNRGEATLEDAVAALQDLGGARLNVMSGDFTKSVSAVEAVMLETMPDALYIDAAYLLSPTARRSGGISKWEQIAEVIGELKQLALRTNRPIIITVQFNRNVKAGGNHQPDTADLAGSDSVGQDASVILALLYGEAPFQRTRRRMTQIKNREGDGCEFEINYTFSPVNLSEIPPGEEATAEDEGWAV